MIHTYKSASGKTTISVTNRHSDKVVYIILPTPLLESELEDLATESGCSIAVLSGLDWNDDLTPWPSPAVTGGIGPFKGESAEFNDYLVNDVAPRVEQILGVKSPERSLVGVSLSGLFALWQWAQDDCFKNIVSISGSFWYDGFGEWVRNSFGASELFERKTGRAMFYLGTQEGKSGPKEFGDIRAKTEKIVGTLKEAKIKASLEMIEGGHKSPFYPRLRRVLGELVKG